MTGLKKAAMLGLLVSLGGLGFAQQTAFARGEELFMRNKPAEALPFLEAAVREDPAHVQAALYLGIAYTQVDRLDDAIAAYRKILPQGGGETGRIAFNLGNAYYRKGNFEFARRSYTQAIEADPALASAYLNRANSALQSGAPGEALPDYERYLGLEPRSAKRGEIERLMGLIREEQAAEEARRKAAEAAAKAEEERKRKLLEEVAASLQAAAEDSQGLSSGAEDVEGYEGEFEME